MMRVRALVAALALLPWQPAGSVFAAQFPPGVQIGAPVDTNTVLGRTEATRAVDTINVLDQTGVRRDTQQAVGNASIASASSALTCNTCTFVASDVGKLIVVDRAGPLGTTGSVTSVPVSTGGSYTAQPSIILTASGGQGAVARPLMQAATAAVATGGSGYTNGTQTLTCTTVGGNTPCQVSVTVTAGVVTAVNSITVAGSYWNINSTGPAAVATSGPGGFGATLNITWSVASAGIMSGGWGYPLTASAVTATMSGGTFTTAATLGTVSTVAPTSPLATTIASFTDSHHVGLAASASTTVSGYDYVTWGHDDQAAIQAALTKACAATGRGAVYLPGDGYGIASDVTIPDACNLLIYGAGRYATTVYALAPMNVNAGGATTTPAALSDMFFKANSNGEIDIRELRINANHLAGIPLWLHGAHGAVIANLAIQNAAPQVTGGAQMVIGDPVTYNYASGVNMSDVVLEDRMGQIVSELPFTALAAYSPDNLFGDGIYPINAAQTDIYDGGNNGWTKPHPFNYPLTILPQYNFTAAGSSRIDHPYFDTGLIAGLHINATASPQVDQPFCFWSSGPSPASACVEAASGAAGFVIDHPMIGNPGFAAANIVTHLGTVSQTEVVSAATGVTGLPIVSGGQLGGSNFAVNAPDSLVSGGNARGVGAFDGQFASGRTAAAQVAAGVYSTTFGAGNSVSSTAIYGGAFGGFNTVDAGASFVLGQRGNTNGRQGALVFSSNQITSGAPAQFTQSVLTSQTTSTAATRLWVGGAQSFQASLNLPQKDAYRLDVRAVCTDTTTYTDFASWHFPIVMFSRATGAAFATMTPATAASVQDAGTTTGFSGTITLANDSSTYPGPNITWTAPNADTWRCNAYATLVEAQ